LPFAEKSLHGWVDVVHSDTSIRVAVVFSRWTGSVTKISLTKVTDDRLVDFGLLSRQSKERVDHFNCARISPFATRRAWPFRIICIASYPSILRRAEADRRKCCFGSTRFLIAL
jgi:hypothetical protein